MRRLTTTFAILAATAAVPAAASAERPSWAGEKPGNYGSCVAYEAMSGGSVTEFIQTTSPLVTHDTEGQVTSGPKNPDGTVMACVINFGAPPEE
jgi:surface antigen